MGRHGGERATDPLSNRAIRAHAGERLRDLWKTQLVGSVVVAIVGFALAWVVSGFSAHVWRQVTSAVVFPLAAVVLWLMGSGLWHYWRAPVRLAREHVRGIGPAPLPQTPLERAIVQQIADAEVIERERPVRGDGGYFDAVVRWAGETGVALRGVKAGNLAVEFEKGGIETPVTVERIRDYMDAKTQLLRDALAQLRSDESP